MPNTFAYIMLLLWPIVAVIFFKKLPVYKALIWSMLCGYLILPSATTIKIPMIPAFDKHSIPAISAWVLCRLHDSTPPVSKNTANRLVTNIIKFLMWLMVLSPLITVMANTERMPAGNTYIEGLDLYDALSMISGIMISIIPFHLARKHLNNIIAHREILRAFVVCGLVYSIPAMVEVRMSPQLHTLIYGFFAHDFVQHVRSGGFRPILFLSHGLMVGIFFCLSILAALVLWREEKKSKGSYKWLFAAMWLSLTLLMVKSVGALVISIFLGLVITLLGRRWMLFFSVVVALIAMMYPILRGANLFPIEGIYEIAMNFSEDRAGSLKFRMDNEDQLLAHANVKPLAGWGGWGRNHIYDSETGKMTSVTDGIWIILIGVYGWTGYIATFGMLVAPILLYFLCRNRLGDSLITPGLIILLSAVVIDFLPNSGLVPYVWMIAGAIVGFIMTPPVKSEKNGPRSFLPKVAKLNPILQ